MRKLIEKIRGSWQALCDLRDNATRDERGIAAVEFALILPLMLMIYLGLVEMSRGMRAAQRLDLVSHTLADLTAQILPINGKAPTTSCTATTAPCINNDDINSIFSAATTLMSPLPVTTLKMTISEVQVDVDPPPPAAPTGWKAKVVWSVARNGSTKRACSPTGLVPEANPKPYSLDKIAESWVKTTNGVAPTVGPLIISDISYQYSPGVHFEFYKWNQPPTWTMNRTSYAAVRNTYVPSHIRYFMTGAVDAINCNAPTP